MYVLIVHNDDIAKHLLINALINYYDMKKNMVVLRTREISVAFSY